MAKLSVLNPNEGRRPQRGGGGGGNFANVTQAAFADFEETVNAEAARLQAQLLAEAQQAASSEQNEQALAQSLDKVSDRTTGLATQFLAMKEQRAAEREKRREEFEQRLDEIEFKWGLDQKAQKQKLAAEKEMADYTSGLAQERAKEDAKRRHQMRLKEFQQAEQSQFRQGEIQQEREYYSLLIKNSQRQEAERRKAFHEWYRAIEQDYRSYLSDPMKPINEETLSYYQDQLNDLASQYVFGLHRLGSEYAESFEPKLRANVKAIQEGKPAPYDIPNEIPGVGAIKSWVSSLPPEKRNSLFVKAYGIDDVWKALDDPESPESVATLANMNGLSPEAQAMIGRLSKLEASFRGLSAKRRFKRKLTGVLYKEQQKYQNAEDTVTKLSKIYTQSLPQSFNMLIEDEEREAVLRYDDVEKLDAASPTGPTGLTGPTGEGPDGQRIRGFTKDLIARVISPDAGTRKRLQPYLDQVSEGDFSQVPNTPAGYDFMLKYISAVSAIQSWADNWVARSPEGSVYGISARQRERFKNGFPRLFKRVLDGVDTGNLTDEVVESLAFERLATMIGNDAGVAAVMASTAPVIESQRKHRETINQLTAAQILNNGHQDLQDHLTARAAVAGDFAEAARLTASDVNLEQSAMELLGLFEEARKEKGKATGVQLPTAPAPGPTPIPAAPSGYGGETGSRGGESTHGRINLELEDPFLELD